VCAPISACQLKEPLLPQTDRATRYISQNLVNCCTTVETSCTANPQQIEVMELDGYRWPTCSKQPRLVDCRIGVVNRLDRRRILLTMRSTCRAKFSRLWNKVPEGCTLILEIPKFNTVWDRWKEASVVSMQYRLVTDGQTDTRGQHIPR